MLNLGILSILVSNYFEFGAQLLPKFTNFES